MSGAVPHNGQAAPASGEEAASRNGGRQDALVPNGADFSSRDGGMTDASDNILDNCWDRPRRQIGTAAAQVPDILVPGGGSRLETNPLLKRKPVPQDRPVAPENALSSRRQDHETEGHETEDDSSRQSVEGEKPVPLMAADQGWTEESPRTQPEQHGASSAGASSAEASSAGASSAGASCTGASTGPCTGPAVGSRMESAAPQDNNAWPTLDGLDKGKGKAATLDVQHVARRNAWSSVDIRSPLSALEHAARTEADAQDKVPPLPPRNGGAWSGRPSSRHVDGKSEMYQVKKIWWQDESWHSNPRTSPILMQNKNGPCPLVALVNALTLTTPGDMQDTALVQVLKSREQISLSLLLDAVFDELMSPRRTKSDESLPDVSELYSFLQSLHTGMNVNPRFIPTPNMVAAYKHTSLTHLDLSERESLIPGTFENTTEMGLYAAFSIPLIHGWLPPRSDPAYEAMERQAASYEEVQNLLFREEELEEKLGDGGEGLTEAEQQLYEDIANIKTFLEASATQLTPWGIQVISRAMRPGTFAILFRNDHFSTLYCHPRTGRLHSLVTDAGYSTHQDIVWESLVDVNGERTEYLSGDFRLVSGAASSSKSAVFIGTHEANRQWSTVRNRREHHETDDADTALEQEDRDLALALQLQEEEEERHREDQERRRRERVLSEQYIEQQAHQPVPVTRGPTRGNASYASVLGRGNTAAVQQQVRPLVPPRQGTIRSAEDGPPPPYEAANRTGLGNGQGSTNPEGGQDGSRQASSVSLEQKAKPGKKKDRDCTVM
ncbi:hypothetical protein CDD82_7961 [Ophiocordyceps australis]|uniref:MINDY deubiquitinase domain-containing protein n=1 Tax=Ophiocordyceps australis TaxID=1399860 RepID=A0A2C5ZPJ6_9HYPO|nr:hypothetical protein CDD82_7961 [Ophiocordyceps australis]